MEYVKEKYARFVVTRTYPEAKNITIQQGFFNGRWIQFNDPKTLRDLPALYDAKYTALQLKLTDRYGSLRHPDYSMSEFVCDFRWEPRDRLMVDVNHGQRPAHVLAVIGKEALIEYSMPAGTTSLWIIQADHPLPSCIRNIAYKSCPKKWLQAIEEVGTQWECNPQQA